MAPNNYDTLAFHSTLLRGTWTLVAHAERLLLLSVGNLVCPLVTTTSIMGVLGMEGYYRLVPSHSLCWGRIG